MQQNLAGCKFHITYMGVSLLFPVFSKATRLNVKLNKRRFNALVISYLKYYKSRVIIFSGSRFDVTISMFVIDGIRVREKFQVRRGDDVKQAAIPTHTRRRYTDRDDVLTISLPLVLTISKIERKLSVDTRIVLPWNKCLWYHFCLSFGNSYISSWHLTRRIFVLRHQYYNRKVGHQGVYHNWISVFRKLLPSFEPQKIDLKSYKLLLMEPELRETRGLPLLNRHGSNWPE